METNVFSLHGWIDVLERARWKTLKLLVLKFLFHLDENKHNKWGLWFRSLEHTTINISGNQLDSLQRYIQRHCILYREFTFLRLADVCHMNPIVTVPFGCNAMVNRWYFEPRESACRSYITCPQYGNNFPTESACREICTPSRPLGELFLTSALKHSSGMFSIASVTSPSL